VPVLKISPLKLLIMKTLWYWENQGSGKSVLINALSAVKTDQGTIKVLGRRCKPLNSNELAILRQKIGFLFQSGALYDSMTIKQNLEFPLKEIKKAPFTKKEMDEKIAEALGKCGFIRHFQQNAIRIIGRYAQAGKSGTHRCG
jgi:phospholipid/cholesterol/gamma-HCH transport system ATP-binding protein